MKKCLYIVFLILCSIMFTACSKQEQSISVKELNPGFPKEEFNWEYNFKTTDEEIVKRADAICMGEIYVESVFPEPYICNIAQIDWDITFSESLGTFMLYLQALNPVSYLTQAYYINGDSKYLDIAQSIIEQWIQYKEERKSTDNPYLWYDHGTAIRSNNLIYFLLAYTGGGYDEEFYNKVISILNEHGEHLANEEEYFENHNHGIFQDQALIYLAYFLNNKYSGDWISTAEFRIENQKEYAFSQEMVHVENSPAYQMGVTELFYQVAEFLKSQGDDFGSQLYDDVSNSLEFMAWATKPNGVLAEIGDTSSIEGKQKTDYGMDKFGNEHLVYAATLGDKGEKPDDLSAVYPKSGYYFGRNYWGMEDTDPTAATWTMFKAGYLSKTHKHADDLSFMLYSKGYDIFVDPGWYNYMSGSKYRDYFVSAKSHNTLIVDGRTYSPTVENSYKTGIFSYNLGENWDEVTAYNNMYGGVQIDRHFFYGGDVIVLIDNIKSDSIHEYSQLFQLSEHMTIESSCDTELVAAVGDSGFKLRIRQMGDIPSLNIINGNGGSSEYGYLSRVMNKVQDINTLKFDICGDNVTLVTVISVENSDGKVLASKKNALCDYNSMDYNVSDQSIGFGTDDGKLTCTWKERQRPAFDKIDIEISDNEIMLQNNVSNAEMWNYAWYLTDVGSAAALEKSPYSESNKINFKIKEDGIYTVKAYMRAKEGNERTSKVVAAIQKKDDIIVDITEEVPYLNLEYSGHDIEKVKEDTYKFSVHYNYFGNTSIAWYIYKDGGSYAFEKTNNVNFIEYHFTEPGSYTVMYYLRTPNGDNEFWNFGEIVIN